MTPIEALIDWIVDALTQPTADTRAAFPSAGFLPLAPGERLENVSRQGSGVFSVAIGDARGIGAGLGGRPLSYVMDGAVLIRTDDAGEDPHRTAIAEHEHAQAAVRALSEGGWQHLDGAPVESFQTRDYTTFTVEAVRELAIEQHRVTQVLFTTTLRADGAA